MRGIGLERQIAELVDDQKLGLAVVGQLVLEPAFGMGPCQGGEQAGGRNEQDRVALSDRLAAEADGKMRFADAWRTEQQERVTIGDPAAGGEIPDLAGVEKVGLTRPRS
jgi:hypothetical protein